MANEAPFDPKVYLATVNGGRTIANYRVNEAIFSQGNPADAVFYIQKGKVKLTVISEQGRKQSLQSWGPTSSVERGV